VLDSTADAVLVTDHTNRVHLVNPAMEQFFNIDGGRAIGQPVQAILSSVELADALTGRFRPGGGLEVKAADGRWLSATVSPILSDTGALIGRVAMLRDISSLKDVGQFKSEFVHMASHDLRTPLTVIGNYAGSLSLQPSLDANTRRLVDLMLDSIEGMNVVVENLLNLARLDSDIPLQMSTTSAASLLASVVATHRQHAEEGGITLAVRIAERLPPLHVEAPLIHGALGNLVTNAIKYAPGSGDVVLSAELEGPEVIFSVRDRGPGIAREDQLHLFEMYYRAPSAVQSGLPGSGCGLALVKAVARRHGGRAWCESAPGQGSTFYISIPHTPGGARAAVTAGS
jgi:PAS domain S-box-containing protein